MSPWYPSVEHAPGGYQAQDVSTPALLSIIKRLLPNAGMDETGRNTRVGQELGGRAWEREGTPQLLVQEGHVALVITIVVSLVGLTGLAVLEVFFRYRPEPHVKGEVLHTGATEGFGKELRQLKTAPFAKELERVLTTAEQYSKDWWELHDATLPALTQFIGNVNAALDHFLRDMPAVRLEIA